MAGLFYKELLSLRIRGKFIFLLLAVYLVLFLQVKTVMELVSMAFMLCTLLPGILTLTSFSNDETCRWNLCALSFPINRLLIVLCKYLFSFLLVGIGLLFPIAAILIKQLWRAQAWIGIYADFCATVLFLCLIVPLLFQFGTQRAQLLLSAVFLIPSILFLSFKNHPPLLPSAQTLDFLLKLSPVLLAAVILLSIFASVQIFSRKEL